MWRVLFLIRFPTFSRKLRLEQDVVWMSHRQGATPAPALPLGGRGWGWGAARQSNANLKSSRSRGGMDVELRVPCGHRSVERRATAKKAVVGRQGLDICLRLGEDA